MTTFHLTSTWHIPAAIETCWFSILDVMAWPDWWKYVDQVTEIESYKDPESNKLHQYVWSTCLPYRLIFTLRATTINPYKLMEFEANGDLTGSGCCKFEHKDHITCIKFEWHVRANRSWMSFASSICKPIFE